MKNCNCKEQKCIVCQQPTTKEETVEGYSIHDECYDQFENENAFLTYADIKESHERVLSSIAGLLQYLAYPTGRAYVLFDWKEVDDNELLVLKKLLLGFGVSAIQQDLGTDQFVFMLKAVKNN